MKWSIALRSLLPAGTVFLSPADCQSIYSELQTQNKMSNVNHQNSFVIATEIQVVLDCFGLNNYN
jgi:hypothetical protein